MDPESAATFRRHSILLGDRQASTYNRFVAKAIDLLLLFAIFVMCRLFSFTAAILVCCGWALIHDSMGDGQSVGKKIMGLRVIDDYTGLPCTASASACRNMPLAIGIWFLAIPLLWALEVILVLPILGFEIYLLFSLPSGTRLGDALANTLVTESLIT